MSERVTGPFALLLFSYKMLFYKDLCVIIFYSHLAVVPDSYTRRVIGCGNSLVNLKFNCGRSCFC